MPGPITRPLLLARLRRTVAASTPGVSHALIVSSDGLPLIAAGGMSPDLADPLAAMTSGIISLGNNIAAKVGEAGCDQVMLKFPSGHFLFMSIGTLAGFAVLAREGANLGVVAHQMAQLVDAVGHVLTPQLRDDPAEHLRRLKAMLLEHFPWEGELFREAEPTDARASLVGAFPGTVRSPFAEVGSDSYVFGIGDVVVVNDPISGQGANNAALAAALCFNAILDRGSAPFTPQWMQHTFDTFWAHAQHSCTLTQMMLEPMPVHAQQVLGAAAQFQEIADRFAEIFVHPATIHDFLLDPAKAAAYVESVAAAHR